MRQIGIAVAAASCTALVLLVSGHSHAVPATKKEQSSGLQGRADHLKRVLHAKRSGMRFVIRHKARYDGKAGAVYWHLNKEAARARRALAKVRKQRGSLLWRALYAKWLPILDCESGDGTATPPWRVDWRYSGDYEGAPNFHSNTWDSYRLPGYPSAAYMASPMQQLLVAERVLASQGWQAWPVCSVKAGYR